eukprot:TRINITY_DN27942_c0_g1_i1.p1 TRINITY_DN27942_c0_g1~~TRINITY_DN27942_c0_g1_i1.p1  ORF type:complete len:477 (+),score=78.81 TRINITY_DN27942_c0_g1_i1:22-1431(+)
MSDRRSLVLGQNRKPAATTGSLPTTTPSTPLSPLATIPSTFLPFLHSTLSLFPALPSLPSARRSSYGAVFPEEYMVCGYLMKEGQVNTEFRRRWFVFEGEDLSYYVRDDWKDKKGFISLRRVLSVDPLKQYRGKEFVFGIKVDMRTFVIQATSQKEMMTWINAIKSMKEFWDATSPTFKLDHAIDTDDPAFDCLGEDPAAQVTASDARPPSLVPSAENHPLHPLNKAQPAPEPQPDASCAIMDMAPPLTSNRMAETPPVTSTRVIEAPLNLIGSQRKERTTEALDFSEDQIDEIVQEMKKHITLHDSCIVGTEIFDWLSVRNNWNQQKCAQFCKLLLNSGYIKKVTASETQMHQTVFKFAHLSVSHNKQHDTDQPLIIKAKGQNFATLTKTLTKIPGSFFIDMLNSGPGEDGIYEIDRNPIIFVDILDYLRDGNIFLPDDKSEVLLLKREAEFYNLPEIIQKCEERLSE